MVSSVEIGNGRNPHENFLQIATPRHEGEALLNRHAGLLDFSSFLKPDAV
jgi:hypothetical protein